MRYEISFGDRPSLEVFKADDFIIGEGFVVFIKDVLNDHLKRQKVAAFPIHDVNWIQKVKEKDE